MPKILEVPVAHCYRSTSTKTRVETVLCSWDQSFIVCYRSTSTKTRVETPSPVLYSLAEKHIVIEALPLKQGLKLFDDKITGRDLKVVIEALPLKQGLKPIILAQNNKIIQ